MSKEILLRKNGPSSIEGALVDITLTGDIVYDYYTDDNSGNSSLYYPSIGSYSSSTLGSGLMMNVVIDAAKGIVGHLKNAISLNDFTFECYCYVRQATTNSVITQISMTGTNKLCIQQYQSTITVYLNGTYYKSNDVTVALNAWHHIAYTRADSVVKIFLNGVLISPAITDSTSIPLLTTDTIRFPYSLADGAFYNGSVKALRVVDRSIYNTNFTPQIWW